MGRRRMRTDFVMEKPEAMTPLRIHMLRLEDTIKMDVKKQSWKVWIGLIWLRMVTIDGMLLTWP